MRLLRLPRLPVSRRRHDELAELVCAYNRIASEDLGEYKRRARKAEAERDEARARADELRRRVIVAEARVAELEQAIRRHEHRSPVCGNDCDHWIVDRELHAVLDGHDRQERGDVPVTYQDGTRYRLNRRQPESTDVGPPDLPEWGYMEGGP